MPSTMLSVLSPFFGHALREQYSAIIRERDREIPRFLFRGFNKRSGGNSNLNTPTAITPHAFYGTYKYVRDDSWIGSAMATVFGPRHEFSQPKPVRLHDMSYGRLRKEICDHLGGHKNGTSHFSSWTADFQVAMDYAYCGPSPHIGVLDTRARHDDNVVMHVLALWEVGFSDWRFSDEYLVYGPVQGRSYTCMTLAWHPWDLCYDLWVKMSPKTTLAHILRARDRAVRHSFYRAGDTWLRVLLGNCTDPALYLTVIAAEWGRSQANANAKSRVGSWSRFNIPGPEEITAMVSNLSWIIARAARSPDLVLPLVNLDTYWTDLPRVHHMISLLLYIQAEIRLLRSRPQPEPFSLFGYFWPQTPDQRRKVDESGTMGDSATRSKADKK